MKRDVSSSLTRGINAKRLCNRLKKKDGQMCELKYEQKFDPKTVRWVHAKPSLANGIFGCIRCVAADRRRWLWMHMRARARTKHKCRAGGSHGSDSGGGVRRTAGRQQHGLLLLLCPQQMRKKEADAIHRLTDEARLGAADGAPERDDRMAACMKGSA